MTGTDIEKELALLVRRWGKHLQVLGVQYEGDVGSAACFKISMPPTDPDFSHEIGGSLQMTITLPVGYPSVKPCEVIVTNEQLHPLVRAALTKGIASQASLFLGKMMVYMFVHI